LKHCDIAATLYLQSIAPKVVPIHKPVQIPVKAEVPEDEKPYKMTDEEFAAILAKM
jgi:hypothetical protein